MDMSNDKTNNWGGAFRQGFLCPFCMEDLGDLTTLHAHVEKYHPRPVSVDNSLDHIKGIIDKAKQKILHIDNTSFSTGDANSSNTVTTVSSFLTTINGRETEKFSSSKHRFSSLQGLGITRSHTNFYLKCRAPCINDVAVKTNNLIIRLDKLINQTPFDSSKRKAFERETVPWKMDCDVLRCQTCSAKFSFTRRRHHCRLCGEVICHICSKFFSFIDARKLTNPAVAAQLLEEINNPDIRVVKESSNALPRSASVAQTLRQAVSSESLQSVRLKSEKLLTSTLSLIKRDDTEVSLTSLLLQDGSEHLRICNACKTLLDVRNEKMEMAISPPMLVVLYERLCSLIHDAQKLLSSYVRISESLSRGEVMYTLDSAVQLRERLIRLQKEIDSVSSGMEKLNNGDESKSNRLTCKEQIIRKNIREFCLTILQQLVAQMNLHPTEDQYQELLEKRRIDIKRRIDMERKRNALILKPSASNPGFDSHLYENENSRQNSNGHLKESVSFTGISGSGDDGWTPTRMLLHINPFIEEEDQIDPLQEQIWIIKGYLKQAVEDGRLEEVEILEQNLHDLESEFEKLNKDVVVQTP
ncbi:unnamed protein product [Thelazia callipaeda]|uniref:FYVE-type domain-containing protein n=1 Tax=Thelazia callipaeda TaxID=103827 RepID=A0A0N5D5E1_THECL|nr:unnamed protein product [Thelazia callipaeda]